MTPSAAQAAQAAMVSALRTFRGNLTSTGTAADGDEVVDPAEAVH